MRTLFDRCGMSNVTDEVTELWIATCRIEQSDGSKGN
tara:strand:- start:538 stop:648 length:111 start_codon:yes stop_codon:yes gene_type:complete